MEHRFSAKLDNAIGEVKEELCVEKASRQRLEGRVAQLEQQHVREQAASTAQLFEDEDVDKSVVVVGGFGDQALEDAEMLVQQMMVGIAGFKEVDMVNVEQPFFFLTRLFDRRTFSSKDCFTGQSPGMSARTMLAIFIPAAPGCA